MSNIIKRVKAYPFRILYAFILAIFSSIYWELFHEGTIYYLTGNYTGLLAESSESVAWHIVALHGLFLFFVYSILFCFAEKILVLVDRYRYPIAAILVVVCVALQISGSSIGQWNKLFYGISNEEQLQQLGVLWGIPRAIRSDEWAVFTPFCLSQEYNSYSATSIIVRGTATDVTTVYGSPAWAIVTLFRPFLWGYMILGSEYGLSFFWCARFFALFLASYECAKIYTNRNLWLSYAAAILISLSPVILWWYNTNGLVEMLVFGQYAIVLINRFLVTQKRWTRIFCALGLIQCAGGFAFTYYPAQEIPFVYVFLVLALWVAVQTRQLWKPHIIECAIILGAALFVLLCLVLGIFSFSYETIHAITSTVYPGDRILSGGGGNISNLLAWLKNVLLPIDPDRLTGGNPCESATFFSLFPCGILLALYYGHKKKDLLLRLLLVLQAFFLVFYLTDIPQWLARITLMSNVTGNRLLVIIGYLDIVLLLRSLSLHEGKENQRIKLFEGIVLSVLFTAIACSAFTDVGESFSDVPIYRLLLFIPAILIFVLPANKMGQYGFAGTLLVVLGVTGICVNPIQRGIPALDMPIIQEIQTIVGQDPNGVWLADEYGFPIGNLPIMAGAPCLNSTNVYPNLDAWQHLDPEHRYETTYNRYSHISVKLLSDTTQDQLETFELIAVDGFQINLTDEMFDLLGVSYVLSPIDYTSDPVWGTKFELISQSAPFYIYKIKS